MLTRSQTANDNEKKIRLCSGEGSLHIFRSKTEENVKVKSVPANLFTIVRTRSQYKLFNNEDKYPVNIDFDGASREWRKNKRSTGNGTYTYVSV